MIICACCGIDERNGKIDRAHVKDKAVCKKEGIPNHEYCNIIPLCKDCHYNYFDAISFNRGRMGIKKIDKKTYFIKLNQLGKIERIEAKIPLNILDEYILWKNQKADMKLLKTLFS